MCSRDHLASSTRTPSNPSLYILHIPLYTSLAKLADSLILDHTTVLRPVKSPSWCTDGTATSHFLHPSSSLSPSLSSLIGDNWIKSDNDLTLPHPKTEACEWIRSPTSHELFKVYVSFSKLKVTAQGYRNPTRYLQMPEVGTKVTRRKRFSLLSALLGAHHVMTFPHQGITQTLR
jgi:hypothetical protein